ncbi:MAG: hypothetical protein IM638_03660 [Bacteroidetes bacterium]|nr:hypothetical protein [Bacteroidota bacterium]
MVKLLCIVFLTIPFLSFAQKSNSELELEIKALKDKSAIENYWTKIHEDDQSVRGKVSEKQKVTDRQNIKKVILMIKYHGYPTGFCYACSSNNSGSKNNFTPNIVITHNTVNEVNEYIFPILKKAFDEGVANEFWYIHNLRGMVRARYGRDFYEKTHDNIPKFIEKLEPFINDSISYDLTVVDSLFNSHDINLRLIITAEKIFSKKEGRIRHTIYKTKEGKLYWQKVYPDGSFNFPIQIYFDRKINALKYVLLDDVISNDVLVKNSKLISAKSP